jgi:hypothetical protein
MKAKKERMCFKIVTPEALAEFVNAHFDVRNPDGSSGIFTVELAKEMLAHPEWFQNVLPEVPPDSILGGNDE